MKWRDAGAGEGAEEGCRHCSPKASFQLSELNVAAASPEPWHVRSHIESDMLRGLGRLWSRLPYAVPLLQKRLRLVSGRHGVCLSGSTWFL